MMKLGVSVINDSTEMLDLEEENPASLNYGLKINRDKADRYSWV